MLFRLEVATEGSSRYVYPKPSPILKPPLCTINIHLKATHVYIWYKVVLLSLVVFLGIRTLIFLALRHKQQFSATMPQRQSCINLVWKVDSTRITSSMLTLKVTTIYSGPQETCREKIVDPYNGSTFDVVHIIVWVSKRADSLKLMWPTIFRHI